MDATPSWFALADASCAWGSACSAAPSRLQTWSVASDCSNVVSHDFEGLFSTSADAISPWLLGLPAAVDQTVTVFGGTCRSVALPHRSGRSNPSARGRLLKMEHAAAVITLFCGVMQCMVAGFGAAVTGSTAPPSVSAYASLPSHGGAQVATIARTAYNPVPRSPRSCAQDRGGASDDLSSLDSKQWEKAFVDCAIVV
ncbi:hypothetical protein CFC21_054219 [Triticum aestivum]|uniref:Uncharacterized protein n=2 Tax=Triticum aestivum TaxID=4565 RepID=A0A3B6HYT5_WHEAT|nr:hypothetical protein CFC21_054219 [Triticum aestivum]